MPQPSKPFKVVYIVAERPGHKQWIRVGAAFVNKDGSLNVRLDALPLTGVLHIRDEVHRPHPDEPAGPTETTPLPAAHTEPKRTS